MRYLSVCSGIEAASVAWKPLGWTAAGFSEIEPFPRAVLQERFGAEPVDWDHRHTPQSNMLPLFGDFTKIEEHHVGPIDLLIGGTPCQSFSVAGKRLGLDDPRGHLTLEYLALAKRLRPRWICWENVPGVLSDDGGRTLGTFLRLLGELGYRWAYRVLDAQYCRVDGFEYAVPQRRRRVFVVGHLGDDARAAAVLFDRESLRGNPAPRREQGKGVAPTIAARTRGGGGLGTDFDCDGGLICSDVAPTLNAAFGDKLGLEDKHINGGGDCLLPPVSLCLNAGSMMRQDPTFETLLPINRCDFDVSCYGLSTQQEPKWAENISPTLARPSISGGGQVTAVAHAIQAGALRENPSSGPDGVGVQEGIAYMLEARSEVQAVAHTLRGEGFDAGEDGTGRGTPLVPVAFAENSRAEIRLCGGDGQVSSQLTTGGGKPGQGQPCIAFPAEMSGTQVASTEDLSPALSVTHTTAVAFDLRGRAGGSMPEGPHDTANVRAADGGSSRSYVAEQWAVRRLTPRECERLQGFPDDWTKIKWRGKDAEVCPDGPRCRSIGNSMAINCMRWIGERIQAVDSILPHDQTQPAQSQAGGKQSVPESDEQPHARQGS
jgi:DNA (cytosine-5)-methyltransferase 1